MPQAVATDELELCVSTDAPKNNKLRQGFVTLAETLLESISDVFPECQNTESVLRIFRAVVKGNETIEDKFIRRCQAVFKEQAEGIKSKNSEALFAVVESLDHLRDMDLREKWQDPDFTEESRDHLWQYVAALKTYADLYTAVPKNVMGKIESVAGNIGEQLARGELDLRNMDLGSIGQNLLADLSAEELSGFEGNLPEIYESLSEVAGSLGGGHGAGIDIAGLMEQLSRQTGEAGGGRVDMTQVLQQLSSQAPPGGGVDMSNLMQVMGPMMQAMQAQRGAIAEGAVTAAPTGRGGHRRSAKKRIPRP